MGYQIHEMTWWNRNKTSSCPDLIFLINMQGYPQNFSSLGNWHIITTTLVYLKSDPRSTLFSLHMYSLAEAVQGQGRVGSSLELGFNIIYFFLKPSPFFANKPTLKASIFCSAFNLPLNRELQREENTGCYTKGVAQSLAGCSIQFFMMFFFLHSFIYCWGKKL